MEREITLKPIGIIHTPYKKTQGMPIQGVFARKARGRIEIFPEYQKGIKDIEGFSHIILIYYFDKSSHETLMSCPFLEDETHGIFAIRSPHRPNHIGFSVVALERVENHCIIFSKVDMLDGTPLLDIKPYVSHFDLQEHVRNGWLDKHFKDGKIP